MGKIITIANHKGGVGKTTTCSALGVALSMKGKRVLLIDLDSQRNLTSLFVHETPQRTIFEAIKDETSLPIVRVTDTLDIAPSSKDLNVTERYLTLKYQGGVKGYTILKRLLEPIRDKYDYVLIDCPPSLGDLTKNAFTASDGVIVSIVPEAFPTNGLNDLLDAMKKTSTTTTQGKEPLNRSLKLFGILITRYNRRKINKLVEDSLRKHFGGIVFDTKIRDNVDISESPLYHKDIFAYSPESIGARDYTAFADEVLTKIN